MKTRNQLNGSRCSTTSTTAPTANKASNGEGSHVMDIDSPSSPPRLRDRRLSGLETKSSNVSAAATTTTAAAVAALPTVARNQTPSLPATTKRLSTGPTRILPKRSCGRQNSLLADNQPNTSAIVNMTNSLQKFNGRSSELRSLRKDTYKQKSTSILEKTDSTNKTYMSKKTAQIKNHLNETIPSTSSASSSNNKHNDELHITGSESLLNSNKQPVCISLPSANTRLMDSIQITQHSVESDNEKQLSNTSMDTMLHRKTYNVLIGVTGSVATIKLVELVNAIKSRFTKSNGGPDTEAPVKIKIVMTKNSSHFMPRGDLINKLADSDITIQDDTDEWSLWKKIEDPVLHIELRKWADLFLIAPLDANTMAKLANGICDNLLTCVVRAWELSKPLIYCPAMNVHMYNHPLTREHLCKLQSFGYFRVDCVEKRLACGDYGMGGMATVESISSKVFDTLNQPTVRKVSLTKPLLNQQPTYPIVSMTEDYDQGQCQASSNFSPSMSNQILNRFRTNNQITIHPVHSNNRLLKLTPKSCAESLLKRPENTTETGRSGMDCVMNGSKSNGHYITINDSGKRVMGGVTSVQNLKAIGLETAIDNLSTGEDELGPDFDPSKLLEQSMVTGDSIMFQNHEQTNSTSISNSTNHSSDRHSSFGQGGSVAKIGSLTPLFNTSKFLALCHNKERGCFTCTICKHDYKNRKSMARHLKEQHVQGNIYQCEPCGVSYKRREKLVKHYRERHQDS